MCRQLESSDIDVINLQEVFTHRDRKLIERNLPSFAYSSYEPSLLGPKGALVTFSRLPIEKTSYISYFSATKPLDLAKLPRFSLVKSGMKGILTSRLTIVPLTLVNTHPLANDDWEWSASNRFNDLQKAQLDTLATVVKAQIAQYSEGLVLGCDLNVAKDSEPFETFLAKSGLHDPFQGDVTPTFHSEFLAGNYRSRCIDVLLASSDIVRDDSQNHRIFENMTDIQDLGAGYITDHQGLSITVAVG